jgi:hypothetical protein
LVISACSPLRVHVHADRLHVHAADLVEIRQRQRAAVDHHARPPTPVRTRLTSFVARS